eukprot:Opistho-2@33659
MEDRRANLADGARDVVAALPQRHTSVNATTERRFSSDELGMLGPGSPLMATSTSANFASRTLSTIPAGAGATAGVLLVAAALDSNRFTIENAVLNDTHALKPLAIHSLVPYPVLVRLQSTLGSQLGFQLSNENIQDGVVVPPSEYNQVRQMRPNAATIYCSPVCEM